MLKLKQIIKTLITVGLGTGLTILATLLLAKFLDAETYGQYIIVISKTAILISAAMLGIGEMMVKYVHGEHKEKKLEEVFTVFLIQYITMSCLLIGIYETINLPMAAICYTLFIPVLNLYSAFLKADEKVATGSALGGSVWPFSLIISLYISNINKEEINKINELLMVAILFAGLVAIIISKNQGNNIVNGLKLLAKTKLGRIKKFKKNIAESTTIGLVGLIYTIFINTDILVMNYYATGSEVANYKIMSLALQLLMLPHVAINSIIGPKVARLITENKIDDIKKINSKSRKYQMMIGVPLAIFAIIIYEPINRYLFGEKYEIEILIVFIFSVISISYYASASSAITLIMLNKQDILLKIYLAVGIINLLLNIMMQDNFGKIGAAMATLISNTILICMVILTSRRCMENLKLVNN